MWIKQRSHRVDHSVKPSEKTEVRVSRCSSKYIRCYAMMVVFNMIWMTSSLYGVRFQRQSFDSRQQEIPGLMFPFCLFNSLQEDESMTLRTLGRDTLEEQACTPDDETCCVIFKSVRELLGISVICEKGDGVIFKKCRGLTTQGVVSGVRDGVMFKKNQGLPTQSVVSGTRHGVIFESVRELLGMGVISERSSGVIFNNVSWISERFDNQSTPRCEKSNTIQPIQIQSSLYPTTLRLSLFRQSDSLGQIVALSESDSLCWSSDRDSMPHVHGPNLNPGSDSTRIDFWQQT